VSEYAWEPTAEYVERANVTRLMRAHGISSIGEMRRRSVEDIGWYWDAVVKDLAIPFERAYTQVLDDSGGIQWTKWFADGVVNLTAACVDRHAAASPDAVALIGEAEDGEVRRFSFAELGEAVDRVTAALRAAGIGKGDSVGVFMPMVPEAVIAAYAVAKVGAVYLPIFSGFAASAVAARLQDAEAKLLFTADGTWRRGSQGLMKPVADDAVAECPSVGTVVVLERLGVEVPMQPGRDVTWAAFVEEHEGPVVAEPTGAEDVFMLAYTSGTTGKP
jgi:acetyl-CoA synthetase